MLKIENLSKNYPTKRGGVAALADVSFEAGNGEFVLVRGPSGSGKTTLLLALGGMMRPTSGRVVMDGTDLYALSRKQLARHRAENIGFVFQMFHLVPYLNVLDNVLLAAGKRSGTKAVRERASELLERLGMTSRAQHRPSELSAGEKQRAAIARAMISRPKLILADEPTGNLDEENAADVVRFLAEFARDGGTVVMVTHGHAADLGADREIRLAEGHRSI